MTESVVPYERQREFARIGGDASLDLINTVSWRLSPTRRIEHLGTSDDLRRWAQQTGVVTAAEGAALPLDPDEVARVVLLREAFYELAFQDGPSEPLTAAYDDAIRAARLIPGADGWIWELPVDAALIRRRVALAMVDLLRGAGAGRLGQCADADCGWVFRDTSPRHNRRWCVAEDCGNRNRARRFYAKTRASVVPVSSA
ncbi:MAG: CGNR zinc finger domain-containing protein [Microbacterium sp.]|uniref:CGNR zinc finger domain-containing protein n=1 Tax=Microbacterium sp. TaxID=51671 RepID=UPI0039E5DE36